jgi:hypothetical protein
VEESLPCKHEALNSKSHPTKKKKKNKLKNSWDQGQWLTPVILTTQEAEIRRIKIQSQKE